MSIKWSGAMSTLTMEERLKQDTPVTDLIRELGNSSLQGFLTGLMGKRGISTDALAELAALNRTSLYRILNGETRHPQRNVLLRLALVLRLSFEETQELLHYGGRASLSGRRARDILLSDGIIRGRSIDEVNERLRAHYFLDLYSKE